ncbi:hypothetical protein P4B35_24205, partial [Pontiellaceae bacterium B12227]|nr:hypothetical protein [Pontiellaceae bacterium B12227]
SITAYTDGTWYNTVIQSVGSSTNINIWISEEGGTLTQVATDIDPTNDGFVLEQWIFGANRAKNARGTFDLANAKIYDDASVSVASLFAEGSGYVFVPETNAVIHSFDALPTFFDSG